jgi:hypothetical protein
LEETFSDIGLAAAEPTLGGGGLVKLGLRLVAGVAATGAAAFGGGSTSIADVRAAAADLLVIDGVAIQVTPAIELTTPTSGTYVFQGQCLVFSDPMDGTLAAPLGCSIASNGTFTNIVCGTGGVMGSATITEVGESTPATASYAATFVSGLGVVTGTYDDDGGQGPLVGLVLLAPTVAGNCVTTPASAFEVTGALVATH